MDCLNNRSENKKMLQKFLSQAKSLRITELQKKKLQISKHRSLVITASKFFLSEPFPDDYHIKTEYFMVKWCRRYSKSNYLFEPYDAVMLMEMIFDLAEFLLSLEESSNAK